MHISYLGGVIAPSPDPRPTYPEPDIIEVPPTPERVPPPEPDDLPLEPLPPEWPPDDPRIPRPTGR
ncbi:MAG: hypothetical protein M3P51_06550 [Chloroflexota bacterium]|nr:hypothetical protein [Chloroflexota bacterium]